MTAETELSEQRRAADWYARLHAPDCTAADRAAFEVWVAERAARGRAYAAAEQLAALLANFGPSSARLRAMAGEALAERADRSRLPAQPQISAKPRIGRRRSTSSASAFSSMRTRRASAPTL